MCKKVVIALCLAAVFLSPISSFSKTPVIRKLITDGKGVVRESYLFGPSANSAAAAKQLDNVTRVLTAVEVVAPGVTASDIKKTADKISAGINGGGLPSIEERLSRAKEKAKIRFEEEIEESVLRCCKLNEVMTDEQYLRYIDSCGAAFNAAAARLQDDASALIYSGVERPDYSMLVDEKTQYLLIGEEHARAADKNMAHIVEDLKNKRALKTVATEFLWTPYMGKNIEAFQQTGDLRSFSLIKNNFEASKEYFNKNTFSWIENARGLNILPLEDSAVQMDGLVFHDNIPMGPLVQIFQRNPKELEDKVRTFKMTVYRNEFMADLLLENASDGLVLVYTGAAHVFRNYKAKSITDHLEGNGKKTVTALVIPLKAASEYSVYKVPQYLKKDIKMDYLVLSPVL